MKKNPSFGVDAENHRLEKTFEQVSADRKCRKISSTDTDCHGLVRAFEEVTVDHKVNVSRGINTTRGPTKMCSNQTGVNNKSLSLKQTAADCTRSAVQECTHHSESDAVTADGGCVQEKNPEVQNEVGQLSGRLTADELHEVYSRVFYRR